MATLAIIEYRGNGEALFGRMMPVSKPYLTSFWPLERIGPGETHPLPLNGPYWHPYCRAFFDKIKAFFFALAMGDDILMFWQR